MAAAGTDPSRIQKPAASSGPPTWVIGALILGPSSVAFPGILAGGWIISATVVLDMDFWFHGR